ncbi:glycosyl transferase family 41-domain-containing protein [Pelagophyceae sp. CCMP2097]|nr:glycosyl transferase family 41-domain-containing protein [Pelagophyceae sp. CCMP2097]
MLRWWRCSRLQSPFLSPPQPPPTWKSSAPRTLRRSSSSRSPSSSTPQRKRQLRSRRRFRRASQPPSPAEPFRHRWSPPPLSAGSTSPARSKQTPRFASNRCADMGKPLRIGFVSADIGVHPVSQLIRGALVALDADADVEVWLFSLAPNATSWWRTNLTRALPGRVVEVGSLSEIGAAQTVAEAGVCLVVDLSGHTLGSSLRTIRHLDVPTLSFLGWPGTTGAPFVGHIVGDRVAAAPERAAREFTEKVMLLPTSYMPSDHAALQPRLPSRRRAEYRDLLGAEAARPAFVFASFSQFGKIDSMVVNVWANILRRCPAATLVLMKYPLHEAVLPRLAAELAARGVLPSRLVLAPLVPWIDHAWAKGAADVCLDTVVKTQHATALDALWAGLPLVSLVGERMESRGAASALVAAGLGETAVHALREYENLAVTLYDNPSLLQSFRATVLRRTAASPLFDAERWSGTFARAALAAAELKHLGPTKLHVVALPRAATSHDR